MVRDLIGDRFCPTGEELINHYLKNKNLGKTWLVDEAIREINICSFKPKFLPKLAKIKSKDPIWYFFSRIEFTSVKKTATKRNTGSGFWKSTGKDRKIKDKRGKGVVIGLKKTLVYHEGKVPNETRTPWVMHEYHITCLPQDQRNYVLCQVMYKGEDGDTSSGGDYSSTVRATTNTAPEFEQPGEGNLFGMSVDDLMFPMNEQEDLSAWDVLDRFRPTGEELIYYLKSKNLGKTWLVDEAIREINICSFKPHFLPKLAKIKSKDPVWHFFSRIEFTSVKKRTTGSGFWKPTGMPRRIRDKRGYGVEIGLKKTLVYYEGRVPNGARTPWVMHEYHITCLPLAQRNYVLCQLMYKGEDGDTPSGGDYSSEPSQPLVSDSNTVRATINTASELSPASELIFPMIYQEDTFVCDAWDPLYGIYLWGS